jgi:hypothetical protein
LTDIRNSANNTTTYPGIARQCYRKAVKTLMNISDKDDHIAFQKYHYLTIAEVGLSQVENPASQHLTKASLYNESAHDIATRTGNLTKIGRANLDKGHIKARTARVQEKSGLASTSTVRATNTEAFAYYSKAVSNLRHRCDVADDFEAFAQALLGCGRMSKKLRSGRAGVGHSITSLRGNMQHQPEEPNEYYQEALRAVEEGILVGRAQGDTDETIEELSALGDSIRASMGLVELG